MEPEKDPLNLPELIPFGGDWGPYQDELYRHYCETLRDSGILFRGTRVSLRRLPEYKGKPHSFLHLISEGPVEEERTPDLRRCERICWVAWIIAVSDSHPKISSWENERRGDRSVVLWHEEENYAVILSRRNGYYLLKTAYLTTPHRAASFRKEREEYFKSINP